MTASKIVAAAASGVGGAGLDVDEVFSTTVYDGTSGSSLSINNGIDLTEGGLVWTKERSSGGGNHRLFSTDASGNHSGLLISQNTNSAGNGYQPNYFTFNNNGYTTTNTVGDTKVNGNEYVSWTFRNSPKFFDIVTYTGNGSSQTISHNLGTTVGWLLIRRTDNTGSWFNYHHGFSKSGNPQGAILNETSAAFTANASLWNLTYPTSTHFTVGDNNSVNASGGTYVAYLFAHNNSDGEFGSDSDQDIIKCGSYTGNGTAGHVINLGFEAQWVLVKRSDSSESWIIYDVMRGMPVDGNGARIRANDAEAESSITRIGSHAQGFQLSSTDGECNINSGTYIYMAIRRGPLAAPEDATKVFAIGERGQNSPPPAYQAGFTVDMFTNRADVTLSSQWYTYDRLRGKVETLFLDADTSEQAYGGNAYAFDQMQGIGSSTNSDVNNLSWMWKRAPGYFDVVAYKSTTSAQTLNHNLSAIPEMMWIKNRDDTKDWQVYHSALGNTKYLQLNTTDAEATASNRWNNTSPTATQFTVGTAQKVNDVTTTRNYIAYLFATVAGVSKVGSYTGTGAAQNIDCGFSSGARFILIKRTDVADGWFVHDSVRGIVAGNDPYLQLNTTDVEASGHDIVDPLSSGFTVNNFTGWNKNGGSYIFYAIA